MTLQSKTISRWNRTGFPDANRGAVSKASSRESVASNRQSLASSHDLAVSAVPKTRSLTKAPAKTSRGLAKRDLLLIVTQLSIMLRSGVDLADAVRSIGDRSSNKSIGEAMRLVYSDLEGGKSLSQALDSQRNRFGGVMAASVAAGEASGRLPEVLTRLSIIFRDELRLHSSVRSAISYPLVLIVVTGFVLAAMVFFVLPQFAGIYAASRAPTPAVTKLLLDGAALAKTYWWVISLTTIGGAVAVYRVVTSSAGRRRIDRALIRLPGIRTISASLYSGRMFRLQGVMLSSGVPMLEVLQLTRHTVKNRCYADLIDEIEASIVNGERVSDALLKSECIPSGAAEMIATAEANGRLGEVLQTVGEFYETEGEQLLRDSVKYAEPAIIVALGLVIGSIVLAVMLPLLDLSTAGK
jgi:type IV pilus assembly protein PilC